MHSRGKRKFLIRVFPKLQLDGIREIGPNEREGVEGERIIFPHEVAHRQ